MMNRKEHMQWCKKRATEYVKAGQLENAVSSMMSDLTKHEDTENLVNGAGFFLMMAGLEDARAGDAAGVQRWIDGFAE